MTNEETTQELLDGRAATYGDRVTNMSAAADMVNAYMDGIEQRSGKREMNAADFAMTMAMYKMYRFAVTPDYSDNIDDIEGYLQIARECVGDQMIHARSADEYQEKKQNKEKGEDWGAHELIDPNQKIRRDHVNRGLGPKGAEAIREARETISEEWLHPSDWVNDRLKDTPGAPTDLWKGSRRAKRELEEG